MLIEMRDCSAGTRFPGYFMRAESDDALDAPSIMRRSGAVSCSKKLRRFNRPAHSRKQSRGLTDTRCG